MAASSSAVKDASDAGVDEEEGSGEAEEDEEEGG